MRWGLDSINFSADAPVLQQLTRPKLRATLLQEKRPILLGVTKKPKPE
jgi:hypothetical protein